MEGLVFPLYVPIDFCSDVGLGFGECLSPGCHVSLVADVAVGVVCGVLAPVTQRSVLFLEEHKADKLKTVKANSEMGSGSTSGCRYYGEALCLSRPAFPGVPSWQ